MGVYRQFSNVQNLGDKGYFPLRVSKLTKQGDGTSTTTRVYERFIFLTSYDESFDANWNVESTPYGRLNPKYTYTQTTRKINLSFTLPARNVAEAKSNLDFCSGLANLVYGDYVERGGDFVYQGVNLTNKIKFGNLLRDELCYFTEFSFSPTMDAGVFEYNGTEVGVVARQNENSPPTVGQLQEEYFQNDRGPDGLIKETDYVYHNQKGKVYPKLVSVTLSAVVLTITPLGFGGPLRGAEYPLRWAQNTGKDWPHGTGPVGVLRYMQATADVAATIRTTIDQFYEDNPTYNIGPDGDLVEQ